MTAVDLEGPRHLAPNTRPEFDLLRVEWIRPSARNPRQRFDEAALEELAESIRQVGLLEPIIVRPAADSSPAAPIFDLIAGERRWRAAQRAGLTDIPAVIRADVDDALQLRLALVENLQRQDLDPLEEAEGYRQLQELGMKQSEIAAAVHRSQPTIANAIRLLKAPQAVQERLAAREISPTHVLALLRYEAFPDVMVKIAEVAAERRTPTKELEKRELGYEFDSALKEAKLAVEVSRGEFDWRAICVEACPFGAFQPAGYYGGLCLKAEHFRELQKAARAAKKAEVEEALEAAAGPDGKPALKLSQLKYGQYERLDWNAPPKGCSKDCECRAIALDSGNQRVGVCLKPQRLRQLREAQREQEQAARKARMEQLAEACGQVLEGVAEVRSRELALLAADALQPLGRDGKRLLAILTKHAPELKAKDLTLDNLQQLQPVQIVKIAIEAVLAEDLRELEWGRRAAYATWYAGSVRPAKGKAKRARKLHDPGPWFQPGDLVMLPNGDRAEVQCEVSGFVEVRDQETGEQVTIGREVLRPTDRPTFDSDERLAGQIAAVGND
jgi:ParB/RepB/Spo0J family partition protein